METRDLTAAQKFLSLHGYVRRCALTATPLPAYTEDIVQQVFVEFVKKSDQWDLESDLKPLLARMTRHIAGKFWREHAKTLPPMLAKVAEHLQSAGREMNGEGQLDGIDYEGEKAALWQCLEKLPEKSRMLIQSYYFTQVSTNELAAQMNTRAGSVNRAISRIREKLRLCILASCAGRNIMDAEPLKPNQDGAAGDVSDLMERYVSGKITESQCERLLEYLRQSTEHTMNLMEQLRTHALLTDVFAGGAETGSVSKIMDWCVMRAASTASRPAERRMPDAPDAKKIFLHWALVLLLCMGVGTAIYQEFFSPRHSTDASNIPEIARITKTVDVVWGEENKPFKAGAPLDREKIKFERGIVKLEFANGAELILEGPAEFDIESELQTFFRQGKCNVRVPVAAKGFAVRTPFMDIIDRGTEFSVLVTDTTTDLHVIEGSVEAKNVKTNVIPLRTGDAVQANDDWAVHEIPMDAKACVDGEAFRFLAADFAKKQTEALSERYGAIASDPDLLLFFDGQRFLGSGRGNFRGGEAVTGVQEQTKAMRLRSVRDSLVVDVPGQFETFTAIMVVRVSRLNHVSRLMIGNDYYRQSGTFFWQLDRNGDIQFHVHSKDRDRYDFLDPGHRMTRSDFGTWTMLAVSVDVPGKSVSHFKDGRLVRRMDWPGAIPLSIDTATVGNEAPEMMKKVPRFLDGDLGELILLGRTVTEKEIADWYDCL